MQYEKGRQPAGVRLGRRVSISLPLPPPLFNTRSKCSSVKGWRHERLLLQLLLACLFGHAHFSLHSCLVFFVTILAPQLRFCLGDLASESDIWHMSQAGGSSSSNTQIHTHTPLLLHMHKTIIKPHFLCRQKTAKRAKQSKKKKKAKKKKFAHWEINYNNTVHCEKCESEK